jgi:hypothetical protein
MNRRSFLSALGLSPVMPVAAAVPSIADAGEAMPIVPVASKVFLAAERNEAEATSALYDALTTDARIRRWIAETCISVIREYDTAKLERAIARWNLALPSDRVEG